MAWTLSGCNDYDETDKTSGTWVTIHEVKGDTEGEALPATNKKETKFTFIHKNTARIPTIHSVVLLIKENFVSFLSIFVSPFINILSATVLHRVKL